MSREIDVKGLVAVLRERGAMARSITALAGPPGAGKSTLAERLVRTLNAAEPGSAAVLPMDGFHYDDMILVPRGWRPRKGAPHTFDVAGFAQMLTRLRSNTEAEIAVPVFDRELEIARNCARIIPASVRHLIVEGNYLLLDEPPWAALVPLFDTTVFLEVPMQVLWARLAARWQHLSAPEQARKLAQNDIPNAELTQARSRGAEFVVRG